MFSDPNKTIVFDVDDTILTTVNRDYDNSVPHMEIIRKIRQLKSDGWFIVFNTARGMGRSKGNIDSVYKQVYGEIESFLKKWDVPYDEIQLGKTWARHYVDDKALTPEQFLETYK